MTDIIKQESPGTLQVPPSQLANEIKELAEALSKSKKDIEEIQNRKLFQRVFSNNTRDIARAMINQGDTISGFLELIKGVIFCQIGNLSTLMALRDGLLKQRDDIDDAGKSYIDLAVNFLDEALTTTKVYSDKFELVESALSEVQRHLTEKAKLDEEQNKAIQSIERHIEYKNQLDANQDSKLHNLEIEIGKVSEVCKIIEKRLMATETNLGNLHDEVSKQSLFQDDFSKSTGNRLKNSMLSFLLLLILTLINLAGLIFLISKL